MPPGSTTCLRQFAEYQVAAAPVATTVLPSIEEDDGTFDETEDPQETYRKRLLQRKQRLIRPVYPAYPAYQFR